MYDDAFVVFGNILEFFPPIVLWVLGLISMSFVLTWIKWKSDVSELQKDSEFQNQSLDLICTFPKCGKTLKGDEISERIPSKIVSDMFYCSKTCMKRDWKENNHHSVAMLFKRRKEELERQVQTERDQLSRSWQDQLADLIPDPHSMENLNVQAVFEKVSMQIEADAANLTAKTFCSAYMKKFGYAIHHWAYECYKCSGKGCVLVHLSDKALEATHGAPISYINLRAALRLQYKRLSRMLQTYDPMQQLVLLLMQSVEDYTDLFANESKKDK
ncbi:hypothetical protein GUITHDRAFT_122026 [Guillardia theta CCMP2712]|uniref:Uncharacterized protein n=1 Tax=Guillardia theta (strain CCMP2712) TaxID=905079 RepID=L1I6V8_GUITC|nr:hypothetical protein GUITHDRAFT_122026 [Guillardia theta CCMP2712]EKX31782.1 hypothetical protein GUITHDRAFT_122026 [Guillardia theta CCMP2712]|eukprot:XP_005818762.1 hypothetical protein GUITHDRAFT_122026 [Guillardia theta CCMP2712]